ncbi:hypothetical protein [Citrobacter phage Tr1]|nr:hypothetical protein [Citrobacter phage Tr1]
MLRRHDCVHNNMLLGQHLNRIGQEESCKSPMADNVGRAD